jgi:hypothetical protein
MAVPVGLASLASIDVDTDMLEKASPVPLTTAMPSEAAVEAPRAQGLDPLLVRVMTTTFDIDGSEAVAVQSLENEEGESKTTAGVVVTVLKVGVNDTVIVLPGPSAPVAEVLKPHVQVEAASFTVDVVAAVTAVRVVTVIFSLPDGLTAVVSEEVATEKFDPP